MDSMESLFLTAPMGVVAYLLGESSGDTQLWLRMYACLILPYDFVVSWSPHGELPANKCSGVLGFGSLHDAKVSHVIGRQALF